MIKSRPFFLTVVCLYLLVSGCYFLFTSFADLKKPEIQAAMDYAGLPYPVLIGMLYLNLVVTIACAMNMMQEKNWARWVYLGWGFVNIDYILYIQSDWHQCVIPIATYLITALVVLVPSANKYFSSAFDYDD